MTSQNGDLAVLVAIVGIAMVPLGLFSLLIYSNYTVCKSYFPEIHPLICIVSSKTRAIP